MNKRKTQQFEYLDVILDDGSMVVVKYPAEFVDEVYESLDHAQQRGDAWWSAEQWDTCLAMYKGVRLKQIAVRRIVGLS
jgi:hypothetical protein